MSARPRADSSAARLPSSLLPLPVTPSRSSESGSSSASSSPQRGIVTLTHAKRLLRYVHFRPTRARSHSAPPMLDHKSSSSFSSEATVPSPSPVVAVATTVMSETELSHDVGQPHTNTVFHETASAIVTFVPDRSLSDSIVPMFPTHVYDQYSYQVPLPFPGPAPVPFGPHQPWPVGPPWPLGPTHFGPPVLDPFIASSHWGPPMAMGPPAFGSPLAHHMAPTHSLPPPPQALVPHPPHPEYVFAHAEPHSQPFQATNACLPSPSYLAATGLHHPPKPTSCGVSACSRPIFCTLSPCGCKVCREHLGTTIRNATLLTGPAYAKLFECVACGATSVSNAPDPDAFNISFESSSPASSSSSSLSPQRGANQEYRSAFAAKPSFSSVSSRASTTNGFAAMSSSSSASSVFSHRRSFTLLNPAASSLSPASSGPSCSPSPSPTKKGSTRFAPMLEPDEEDEIDFGGPRSALALTDGRVASLADIERPPLPTSDTGFPIVKIENLPFMTTTYDIEALLKRHNFANAFPGEHMVINAIHLVLHRETGRTLPHCYIEITHHDLGQYIIDELMLAQLGDRTIKARWERRGELLRDLFSQEEYFRNVPPSSNLASAPLPQAPKNYDFKDTPLLTERDFDRLLELCREATSRVGEGGIVERPFLNIVTLITKFPWATERLWDEAARDAFFDCASGAFHLARQNLDSHPTFRTMMRKLGAAILRCPGFAEAQKLKIGAHHPERVTDAKLSPCQSRALLPLMPTRSARSRSVSLSPRSSRSTSPVRSRMSNHATSNDLTRGHSSSPTGLGPAPAPPLRPAAPRVRSTHAPDSSYKPEMSPTRLQSTRSSHDMHRSTTAAVPGQRTADCPVMFDEL